MTITVATKYLPTKITKTGKRSPQLPRKNDYFRPISGKGKGRARIIITDAAKAQRIAMIGACNRLGLVCSKARPLITFGLWHLELVVVAGRKRGELVAGQVVPLIDSDACLAPVKDALSHAGVIDDDWRIDSDRTMRFHAHALPSYSVTLTRIDGA
jgi:hypothetical protein